MIVAQTWENPGLGGRGPPSVACALGTAYEEAPPTGPAISVGTPFVLEKILPRCGLSPDKLGGR